jgi:hypothetical protein
LHYHAYSYEGPGEAIKPFDGARRVGGDGFDTAVVPPEVTHGWLYRPPRVIRATWDDPAEAVAWLVAQWRETVVGHEMYPGLRTRAPSVETLAAYSLEGLTSGTDEVWSAWLRGCMYAHLSVICCPNWSRSNPPCPLGRVDTRPSYATRE